MSLRHLRKLNGGNSLPQRDDSSSDDEVYQPLSVNINRPRFSDLVVTSSSDTSEDESSEGQASTQNEQKLNKYAKRKKARRNRRLRRRRATDAGLDQMDEIDKSVMEVNRLLGYPPPAPPEPEPKVVKEDIFAVNVRHLNVTNELNRLFGPDIEEGRRNRGRVPNLRRVQKQIIIPSNNISTLPLSGGLSMSLKHRQDGYTYFVFDHSKDYQKSHLSFLLLTDHRLSDPLFTPYDDTFRHVEARLEMIDFLFMREEYTLASTVIDAVIYQMQSTFHPLFHLSDSKTRLLYKYIENRAFHIAILKYIHLLSNKACHRTALELAKVLMNLDPTDPLAVFFIIDTLAIRAREFEWIIKAIDHWNEERNAHHMFNMLYSYALAKYHLTLKDSSLDKTEPLQALQRAILRFPMVALNLLELANSNEFARLSSHPMFSVQMPNSHATKAMKEIYFLYAKFSVARWREPEVFDWLVATIIDTANLYETDSSMKDHGKSMRMQTNSMFHAVPEEVKRHLCVIKPMSHLLVDGAVPDVPITRLSDPLPVATTVDRPGYTRFSSNYSSLRRMLRSDLPSSLDVMRIATPNADGAASITVGALGALISSFFTFQVREQDGDDVYGNHIEMDDPDVDV